MKPATKAVLLIAAKALNGAAARCLETATREERRQCEARRTEAERVAAAGEATLAEFINTPELLAYAEGEIVLAGQAVPDRLSWELNLWSKLAREAGEAVAATDPAWARRAVEEALALARMAAR